MKHSFIFLLLFFTASLFASEQDTLFLSSRSAKLDTLIITPNTKVELTDFFVYSSDFEVNGVRIKEENYQKLIESYPSARAAYKSYRSASGMVLFFSVGGALSTIYGAYDFYRYNLREETGEEPSIPILSPKGQMIMLLGGLGAVALSIPIAKYAKVKLRTSVSLYNNRIQLKETEKTSFRLTLKANEIGLLCDF